MLLWITEAITCTRFRFRRYTIIDQFSHISLYSLHEGEVVNGCFRGHILLFERCVPKTYNSNRPLMVSSFSIVQACTIHPSHPPRRQIQAEEREYLTYRSYFESIPSTSPWPNRPPNRSPTHRALKGHQPLSAIHLRSAHQLALSARSIARQRSAWDRHGLLSELRL